jgi:hypothetical protein
LPTKGGVDAFAGIDDVTGFVQQWMPNTALTSTVNSDEAMHRRHGLDRENQLGALRIAQQMVLRSGLSGLVKER